MRYVKDGGGVNVVQEVLVETRGVWEGEVEVFGEAVGFEEAILEARAALDVQLSTIA